MILGEIVGKRKEQLARELQRTDRETMRKLALRTEREVYSFPDALKTGRLSIIAEVKKASPSKSVICADFHPVEQAAAYERAGADAVVAEGMESGGHIGEETTMTLVPQVVDAVDIPVIAAGGIGDGRGVCAAFMLGAEAVQMGTRFVVAKESNVHQNYKDRVIAAKDIDSVVTGRSTGHPVRSLRNSMTREYLDMEKEGVEFEKLERLTLGTLRKAVVDGDVKQGTVMAGQIAGLVSKEQTCEEIIKELMKEVSEVYNSHNKLA